MSNRQCQVKIKSLAAFVVQVKRENAEREALGALPLYQRTLPWASAIYRSYSPIWVLSLNEFKDNGFWFQEEVERDCPTASKVYFPYLISDIEWFLVFGCERMAVYLFLN